MIDKLLSPQLIAEADNAVESFKDCHGYRAKPSLDGSFPSYGTLKYFAMPKALRSVVKDAVSDIDKNIETYFLKFNEGDKLPDTKSVSTCFFTCKAVLLYGEVKVRYKSKEHVLKSGDEIEIEPKNTHSITPTKPSLFMVEMQVKEL